MCGIHFVINPKGYAAKDKLDDFMSDCFLANQVRGLDSSGMFQVKGYLNHKGERDVQYYKNASCGSDYISDRPAKTLITAATSSLVSVGHVRAAPQGSINSANAHPFTAIRDDNTRIIGVHNGTLTGWRNKKNSDKFDVDSQWLFDTLARDGVDSFEAFDGAWALVWFDSRFENKLFIARNDKRPLFYAFTEEGGMVGASELGMLGWLADRNRIALKKNDKGFQFFYPQPGHVSEVNLSTMAITSYKYKEYNANSVKYSKPAPVAVAAIAPVRSSYTPATAYNSAAWQDGVLTKLKAALETGRKRSVEDASAIAEEEPPFLEDDTGFEAALQKEVQEFQKTREIPRLSGSRNERGADLGYIIKPAVGKSCSAEERRAAKDAGMFGMVVDFVGYFYDGEDATVYGDFVLNTDGVKETHDAIIRGLSQAAGESKYVHPSKSSRLVVLGMSRTSKNHSGSPFVILGEIQEKEEIIYPTEEKKPALRVLH